MKDHINIQDEKENHPFLDSVSKANPFDVPENYFENLASKIADTCLESEKTTSVRFVKFNFRKVLIPLAIAASVTLVFLFSNKNSQTEITSTNEYSYIDHSYASEYLNYLVENDELDESLIISELINDDTGKIITNNSSDEENIRILNENPIILEDTINNLNITEDDIIQYLLEEDDSDELFN